MKKIILSLLAILCPSLICGRDYSGEVPHDRKTRMALDIIADPLGKNYGLQLLNINVGDIGGSKEAIWGLSFMSRDHLTLEESRPMIATMARGLLHKLYQDPIFYNFVIAHCSKYDPNNVIENKDIAYKIAFWDENMDRPLPPNLAQITFDGNNVTYFYADPKTQGLQKETVTESLVNLEKQLN